MKNPENFKSASFWSRYLLWEKTNIFDAISNIQNETGMVIKFTPNTIKKHQSKLAKLIETDDDSE